MQTTRRLFIKQGAMALASVGIAPTFGPAFLRNAVFAAEPKNGQRRKTLICIFQRGAVDGLSMVVPHGDAHYYQHRALGNNGIALPHTGEGAVVDLDGMFGFNPVLGMLKPIYDAGHLAAIQACGSPNPTRSHFDAQDYMESATPGFKGTTSGWLTRALQHCPEDKARRESVIRAVSMTAQVPRALQGDSNALAIPDLNTFDIKSVSRTVKPVTTGENPNAGGGFEALYDGAVGDVLHGTGRETFDALKQLRSITATSYVPAHGAQYPRGAYGQSLQQVAQLIKADVGLQIAFVASGGWDTHIGQGNSQGPLARRLQEFGQGLSALYTDMGDAMADVVVLTMSEFGRTVRQNGNGGTDHGHATCFLALGGNIQGGRVLGQWPGLAPEQLYEDRDLAVTTDFRAVFGEVAQRHLGIKNLAPVFPNFTNPAQSFRGVLRA